MAEIKVGDRFVRAEVIGEKFIVNKERSYFPVQCDCGKKWNARADSLKAGKILSCGCLGREIRRAKNTVHGLTPRGKSPAEYTTWASMIQRCCNPKSPPYKYYGARGIRVCERWRNSFSAFLEDMGPRPYGKEIDRVDNDGDYMPGNCRWTTRKAQMQNTRGTRLVTYKGKMLSIAEVAAAMGILRHRIDWRVSKYRITHQAAVDHYVALLGTTQ